MNKKHVILGLSGGVDSTAAALLLREQGYKVTGLYFDVLENNCAGRQDAQRAADELDIPLVYRNVAGEFEQKIVDYFCNSYMSGETPNPCIKCNPEMKFRILAEEADKVGASHIATGHYAISMEGRIRRAKNHRKDQSYMLYRLPSAYVERLILPLGAIGSKDEVRNFVEKSGIFNAGKKDSQEICFVKDGGYLDFLRDRGRVSQPGPFLDIKGNEIGQHAGISNFTIGQRKGLGQTFGKPMFVVGFNLKENGVVLGEDEDLFRHIAVSEDHIFFGRGGDVPDWVDGFTGTAKIRYSGEPTQCRLQRKGDGQVHTEFASPQRAITPGQSIVFYDEDLLVGGGYIKGSK